MPEALLQVIWSRPELTAYAPKLQWVKSQMEHAHSVAQAHYAAGSEKALQAVDTTSTSGGSDTSGSSGVIWFYS